MKKIYKKSLLLNLLSQGETSEVLNYLQKTDHIINNQSISHEVSLLSARFSVFMKDKRGGLLDYKDEEIKFNKINHSIIELIKFLPDLNFFNPDVSENKTDNKFIILQNPLKNISYLSFDFIEEVKNIVTINATTVYRDYFHNGIIIDLLSTYKMGLVEYSTAIFCVDKNNFISDDYIEYIENAQKIIDTSFNILIVTEVKQNSNTLTNFSKIGVKAIDIKGLINNLLNFDAYQNFLIQAWIESDICNYYVPLEIIENEEKNYTSSLEKNFNRFLTNDEQTSLVILGEYGTGKSTFSKYISYKIAKRNLGNIDTSYRVPILFNLSDFNKEINIESLIVNHLDRECNVQNPKFSLFDKMNKSGLLLLIFDGFDEMAAKVTYDVLLKNISQIQKMANPSKSKVLITSRPEYFINADEENKILSKMHLNSVQKSSDNFFSLKLSFFSTDQIYQFISNRLITLGIKRENTQNYIEAINDIYDLRNLSTRPVLLNMIIQVLPILIKEERISTISVNLLYQTFLNNEIERQIVENNREMLLNSSDRFNVMGQLAFELFYDNKEDFDSNDIILSGNKFFNTANSREIEYFVRDFLNCSFLTRRNESFRFSHKSIYEYLVSKRLYREILKGDISIFGRKIISKEILHFLSEEIFIGEQNKLITCDDIKRLIISWIMLTKIGVDEQTLCLGGNSLSLLAILLKGDLTSLAQYVEDMSLLEDGVVDFSGTNIEYCYIKGAEINNIDFSNCLTKGSVFVDCTVHYLTRWTLPDQLKNNSSFIIPEREAIESITIFTSDNSPIDLPKGSSVLDFAFNIHTELGLYLKEAKVNGRIVSLNYKLKHGDKVHIIKGKSIQANEDWFKYIHTFTAQKQLRRHLKNH